MNTISLKIKLILLIIGIYFLAGISLEFTGSTDFFEIDELILGYHLVYYDGIIIVGPDDFNNKTIEALKYIKENDKENYNFVKINIAKIKHRISSGMNILFGTFNVGESYKSDLEWYSSIIIHDACHADLFRRSLWPSGGTAERICMEKQNEFFSKVGYSLIDIEEILRTMFWLEIFIDW